ncbi:MAG TPA: hypothetical protein VFD32_14680 [Dehalococcoidia bacterium]|nr:hypothetical protein [Dehalococcoidia bacterium]
MPDRPTRLAETLGGSLCAFGAALATAPSVVLMSARLPQAQGTGLLFARLTGVRDLAFGAALLGTRGAVTRRRLLRIVAAVAFADALLLLFGRLPGRSALVGAAASTATGVTALLAATGGGEVETRGTSLLVAGSLLSAAPALQLAPIVRRRRARAFAAFEAGAALSGAAWLRRGNRAGGAIDLGAALGALAWWVWEGRRSPGV